ncbi:MAG: cbb3-type cytochrome c oxidase subunit 3 [Deltaproteobacteria bacterium]|nr:cbb3-type cytochrome c oxidase subunit 3 [Deltaproteobacteria bacterium]
MEGFLTVSKTLILVSFFLVYCGLFAWLYVGKNRKKVEENRNIPFLED